jgi:hypothetical protein
MSVTIVSDGADGKHYQITLAKMDADKGTIRVDTWESGQDTSGPPGKTDTQSLYDIKAKADASMLVCKADVFVFVQPTVTFTIHDAQPPAKPDIRVKVSVPGHDADYPVTPSDKAKIKQFIVTSAFPKL